MVLKYYLVNVDLCFLVPNKASDFNSSPVWHPSKDGRYGKEHGIYHSSQRYAARVEFLRSGARFHLAAVCYRLYNPYSTSPCYRKP